MDIAWRSICYDRGVTQLAETAVGLYNLYPVFDIIEIIYTFFAFILVNGVLRCTPEYMTYTT